jgi:serine/threonine protein kinase
MAELPLVGDEFAGYRLRAVLGRGGMSVVYQAENPRLGSVIALKVLAPELAADDVFRARFLEESRIAASLNHPNVIPIYDTGSHEGLLYIAMRYVSGTDLRQVIKKRGRRPAGHPDRDHREVPGPAQPSLHRAGPELHG